MTALLTAIAIVCGLGAILDLERIRTNNMAPHTPFLCALDAVIETVLLVLTLFAILNWV